MLPNLPRIPKVVYLGRCNKEELSVGGCGQWG